MPLLHFIHLVEKGSSHISWKLYSNSGESYDSHLATLGHPENVKTRLRNICTSLTYGQHILIQSNQKIMWLSKMTKNIREVLKSLHKRRTPCGSQHKVQHTFWVGLCNLLTLPPSHPHPLIFMRVGHNRSFEKLCLYYHSKLNFLQSENSHLYSH